MYNLRLRRGIKKPIKNRIFGAELSYKTIPVYLVGQRQTTPPVQAKKPLDIPS